MAEHDVKVTADKNSEITAEQLITTTAKDGGSVAASENFGAGAIIDHLDIWTSAIKQKSASGRGSSKKFSLHGIKKLRELILELAVRGKLVPQDENDEPASALLERITAEKTQLIKEKKIKKNRKQPEITQDEIYFTMPENWRHARLEDIYDVRDGTHDSPKPTSEGYPLVTSKNLSSGKLDLSEVKLISKEDHMKVIERSRVDKDDILFAMIGSIGNPVIVDTDIEFSIKNVGLFKYYNPKDSSPYYLNYFLKYAAEIMKKQSAGGVQPFVSLGKLRGFVMPIPPLAEQHRIVAKVDELMSLCDALEAQTEASKSAHQTLVETLLGALLLPSADANSPEQHFIESWQRIAEHFDTLFTTSASIDTLKQTILQLAVMGKLVEQASCEARNSANYEPAAKLLERIAAAKAQLIADKRIKKQKPLPAITDEEKPFELPNGWSFAYMQDLCSLITDGTHQTPKYAEEGRPFVSAQCVKPFKFMPEKCRYVSEEHYQAYIKNRKPEYKDILLARVGAGIGEAALIDSELEFAIYVSTGLLKPHKCSVESEYLVLWLNSPVGRGFSEINTLGKGVSQGNLNLSLIRSFVVSLPPLEEQHRIVTKVDELMALCDQLKARLSDAQTTQLHLTDAIVEQTV